MATKQTDSSQELNRAIEGLSPDKSISVRISKPSPGEGLLKGTVIITTEEIDNVYDEENDWRWDILLNPDGTWEVG